MKKILVIYGPTATGKTALAIDLAKKFDGEIISADSRQVYRGLDIGSGKLSIEQFNNLAIQQFEGYWVVDGIKIHGFDLADPGDQFTVADFLKFAADTINRIRQSNKLPIVVGGTGFYMKALTSGIDSLGIPKDKKLRNELEKLPTQDLYQQLLQLDPSRAKSMNDSDRQNPRRLIRAIEIALSNQKLNIKNQKSKTTNYQLPTTNYLLVGLIAPNDFLYRKAENWINERLKKGMLDEIKGLMDRKINQKWLDDLGLEYRWLSRYLVGKIDYNEAIARLTGDYHSFIRRQKTWFKQFKGIKLFDISQPGWSHQLEKNVKDWYNHTKWAKKNNL